jgi:hypothetical protein
VGLTRMQKSCVGTPLAPLCAGFVLGAPDENLVLVGAKTVLRRTTREDFGHRRS